MLTIVYVLITLVLMLILFIGIGVWIGSGRLLRVTGVLYTVTLPITGATEETVTLPRKVETAYDGIYGVTWQSQEPIS